MMGKPQTTINQLEAAILEFQKWARGLKLTKEEIDSLGDMLTPITWLRENKKMPDSVFFIASGYHDWVQRAKKASKTSNRPWGFSLHATRWPKGDHVKRGSGVFMCEAGRVWYRKELRPDIALKCMVNDLSSMRRTAKKNKGA